MPKFELYDVRGRVKDKDIAHEMAKVEDPYHNKRLGGLLKPSAAQMRKGERAAEAKGKELIEKKNAPEMRAEEKRIAQEFYQAFLNGIEKNRALRSLAEKEDCVDIKDAGDKGIIVEFFGAPSEGEKKKPVYKIWMNQGTINTSFETQDRLTGKTTPRGIHYQLKDSNKILEEISNFAEYYRPGSYM